MATITTDLICNLNQPVAATFLHGNMFSQDNAGNTINVHVMDNGEPATIGGTVSANVIRADGNTVAVSGSLSGNQCSVVLPQACYAVPGRVEIIIKLTQSTTITTIAAIVANVYRSTTDTVVDPGTIIPSIQALIEEIEDAVDSIPVDYSGLLDTIAADYSSSKTYPVVGMYAWQGGVLKRNIVPITTAETYTAAHWTNAVLGDDVSALKSAINNNKKGIMYFDMIPNSYVETSGAIHPYNNWKRTDYTYIGDCSKLTAKTSASSNYNCFYDATKTFISSFTVGTSDTEITVPENAEYVIFSNTNAGMDNLTVSFVTKIQTDINDLKSDVSAIETTVENIGEDVSAIETTVENIGEEVSAIETTVENIGEEVSTIETDVEGIEKIVGEIEQRFENNGDIFNMIRNTFVDGYIASDGTIVPYSNYSYTDFIPIEPTTEYTFLARSQNGAFEIPIGYVASYNDNHEIVEYINGATVKDKTFAGAKYVRLSWYSATLSIAIFGQSVAFDTLVTTKKEIPYKESPSQYVDLSSSDTKVTSWKRNSKLFPGHSVKAINRIGNIGGAPENSIAGFINAINAGFDILLVDIIWTADGIPVCCHDNDISRVARTNEGGSVSGVLISNTNYSTLYENYDFGIVKGEKYKGTKILRFDDFIRFAKHLDVYVYAEFKNFDSANYSVPDTVRIAYSMGMGDRVAWHGGFAVTRIIHNNFPNAAIAYYMASGAASDAEITNAISLKGENDVFLFGWDTTTFTNEQINTLIQNNISFECGTLNTEADIVTYIANNPYCRGIESDTTVASIALIKKYIDY